jgi:hypothetical protein
MMYNSPRYWKRIRVSSLFSNQINITCNLFLKTFPSWPYTGNIVVFLVIISGNIVVFLVIASGNIVVFLVIASGNIVVFLVYSIR